MKALEVVNLSADFEKGNVEKPKTIHSFEEAVSLTGNGWIHYVLLLVSGFAFLGVMTEGLNMAVVLPAARCDLHFTTAEQGLINAVGFIGVIASSHFWGFLADTWGRKKVLKTALFCGFIFSALSSLSVTTVMLLVTRLLVGLCLSGTQASAISYLGEFHGNSTRLRALSFVSMFAAISISYQAVIGWIVMTMDWEYPILNFLVYKPWRMYILISGLINAACFVVLLFLPESPKFMLALGKQDEALDILKWVYAKNTGKSTESFPVKEIQLETIGSNLAEVHGFRNILATIWKQTWPLFMPPHLANMIMLCYLSIALYIVAHGIYLWYPMILQLYNDNTDLPITTCEAIRLGGGHMLSSKAIDAGEPTECIFNNDPLTFQVISLLGLIFIILYLFAAFSVNRLGRTLLLTSWISLTLVMCTSLIWANNFYLNTFLVLVLMSCGNCGSILPAVSSDIFPTHYKGMALCFIMMAARIGSVSGSNIVGALLSYNCEIIFYLGCGLLISCIIICYIVLKKADNAEKAKIIK